MTHVPLEAPRSDNSFVVTPLNVLCPGPLGNARSSRANDSHEWRVDTSRGERDDPRRSPRRSTQSLILPFSFHFLLIRPVGPDDTTPHTRHTYCGLKPHQFAKRTKVTFCVHDLRDVPISCRHGRQRESPNMIGESSCSITGHASNAHVLVRERSYNASRRRYESLCFLMILDAVGTDGAEGSPWHHERCRDVQRRRRFRQHTSIIGVIG